MSIQKYMAHFEQLREEIEEQLSEDDISRLSNSLKTSGKTAWDTWLDEHSKEISLFLIQTPSERKKKAIWKTEKDKLLGLLGALVFCRRACIFARSAEQLSYDIDCSSYRSALSTAATEAWGLSSSLAIYWPFSGETPWGEEQEFFPYSGTQRLPRIPDDYFFDK
ncbi:hypothetical protein Bwad001_08690 [Bilophila wadsworthia]|uniref:hypothetical protein n=1 Tax=Bilophila wadsworthia TaxID=35833 RepID=UPI0012DEE1A9|nr:hypothetical protein [Bilophila wadsworthia]